MSLLYFYKPLPCLSVLIVSYAHDLSFSLFLSLAHFFTYSPDHRISEQWNQIEMWGRSIRYLFLMLWIVKTKLLWDRFPSCFLRLVQVTSLELSVGNGLVTLHNCWIRSYCSPLFRTSHGINPYRKRRTVFTSQSRKFISTDKHIFLGKLQLLHPKLKV